MIGTIIDKNDFESIQLFEALENLQNMGLIKYQLHSNGVNLDDASISVEVISDACPIDFQSMTAN